MQNPQSFKRTKQSLQTNNQTKFELTNKRTNDRTLHTDKGNADEVQFFFE